MNIQLILALVIALSSFGGGWTINGWRYGAKEKERVEQVLRDQRAQAATAIRRIDNVSAAQSAAAAREHRLRADADGARTALGSLRDAADAALRAAASSHEACLVTASAATDVLKQSSDRYRELAETCDRHVSDIKTLMESWPQ